MDPDDIFHLWVNYPKFKSYLINTLHTFSYSERV